MTVLEALIQSLLRGIDGGSTGRCSLFSLKRGKDACSGVETEHRQAEEMPSVRTIRGSHLGITA